jgi:ammonium transporter Rh
MENILNATLAGGVIIGACSDLVASAFSSMVIGFVGGVISFFGFQVLAPFLREKIGLHDTAGIHNLHGMPGFMGGIIGAITAGTVDVNIFNESLGLILANEGVQRTPHYQGCYQLAAIAVTLAISIFTGIFTGWLLRQPTFDPPQNLYTDRDFWHFEGFEFIDSQSGHHDEEKKHLKTNHNEERDHHKHNRNGTDVELTNKV